MNDRIEEETSQVNGSRVLSESEVALLLRITKRGLRNWRRRGFGPAHIHIGQFVRYTPQAVEKFIEGLPRGGGKRISKAVRCLRSDYQAPVYDFKRAAAGERQDED